MKDSKIKLKSLLKEEEIKVIKANQLDSLSKEELLKIFLLRIKYAGAGYFSQERKNSIPSYEELEAAILKRMVH